MNERIKELVNRAWASANPNLGQFHSKMDEINQRAFQKKFAELIVKECAKCCTSATQEGQPLHLVSLGYAQRIKEHFGVE